MKEIDAIGIKIDANNAPALNKLAQVAKAFMAQAKIMDKSAKAELARQQTSARAFIKQQQSMTSAAKQRGDTEKKETEQAKKNAKARENSYSRMAGLITKVLAAIGGIALVKMVANMADAMNRLSKAANTNIVTLTAWGNAAKVAGFDAGAITGDIDKLNGTINKMRFGEYDETLAWFNYLNIALTDAQGNARKATDVMLDVASAFEGMDSQKALYMGEKMGFDRDTVQMLMQGRKQVEANIKRQEQLTATTQREAKAARALNAMLAQSKLWLEKLARSALVVAMPAIEWLNRKFAEFVAFLEANRPAIQNFFKRIVDTLTNDVGPKISNFFKSIWEAAKPLREAFSNLLNSKNSAELKQNFVRVMEEIWQITKKGASKVFEELGWILYDVLNQITGGAWGKLAGKEVRDLREKNRDKEINDAMNKYKALEAKFRAATTDSEKVAIHGQMVDALETVNNLRDTQAIAEGKPTTTVVRNDKGRYVDVPIDPSPDIFLPQDISSWMMQHAKQMMQNVSNVTNSTTTSTTGDKTIIINGEPTPKQQEAAGKLSEQM